MTSIPNSVCIVSLLMIAPGTGCNDSTEPDPDTPSLGVIAFSLTPPDDNNEIHTINSDGSGLLQITDHEGRDAGPAWSPDGTEIAFYVHFDESNTWSEFIMDADGSNRQRLTDRENVWDSAPAWTPDGRIIFGREYPLEGYRAELWIMNSDGSEQRRLGEPGGSGPDCSPDGSKIAFYSSADGDGEIWTMDLDGSNATKLTDNESEDYWPAWSPDGEKIAFQSNREGNHDIFVMDADGGSPVRITDDPADDWNPDWSPDGNEIVFVSERDGHLEVYTMNAEGSNQTRLTTTIVHAIQPAWKP